MTRLEKIIEIINKEKKVEVSVLSEVLKVSEVTIRKDLSKLEELGIIQRQHGFAQINNENDMNFRMSINYNIKRKIAELAAESVNDGEAIMIESGSTCALLADQLAESGKNVTLITNSAFIATRLREADKLEVVLLGGYFQKDSQVNVGSMVVDMARNFHVKKFFVGVDGFDDHRGFTGVNLPRTEVAKELAKLADETIVLTDSSKFGRKGTIKLFDAHQISQVYTDSLIDAQCINSLEDQGVKLNIVEAY